MALEPHGRTGPEKRSRVCQWLNAWMGRRADWQLGGVSQPQRVEPDCQHALCRSRQ